MSTRTLVGLSIALLVLTVPLPAASYSLFFTTSYGGETLTIGDQLSFDVRLDTEGPSAIQLFGIPVIFDPSVLAYNPGASSTPSYILYSPPSGPTPERFLFSQDNPPVEVMPVPGVGEVLINYLINNLLGDLTGTTTASSSDELLATIAFDVVGGGQTDIGIDMLAPGGVFRVNQNGEFVDLESQIALDPPITVTAVPEPGSALLVGWGLVVAGALRRRRG